MKLDAINSQSFQSYQLTTLKNPVSDKTGIPAQGTEQASINDAIASLLTNSEDNTSSMVDQTKLASITKNYQQGHYDIDYEALTDNLFVDYGSNEKDKTPHG